MNSSADAQPPDGRAGSPALPLPLESLGFIGSSLVRPECVLATAAGDLFTADWRGGVAHVRPDGSQALYCGPGPEGLALKPNGIALLRDGSFLLTHLGNDEGGVFQLQRDGRVAPWLLQVDGVDLPPTNFVVEDAAGRFWVSVSTRLKPRALGYRRSCNDGFIVRVDARGAAIVADGCWATPTRWPCTPADAGCISTRLSRAACRVLRCMTTVPSAPRNRSPSSALAPFPTVWPSTKKAMPGWSASSATA